MDGEHQQQRNELAEQLKQVPKEKRRGLLDQAKLKEGYWQAKTERAKGVQEEEPIDDGLGVFIKKKTLYHGSGTEGITALNKAEEDTVGSGVYFTSEAKDAIGYARLRAKEKRQLEGKGDPIIYEAAVENAKFCDLRKEANTKKILEGFLKWVEQRKEEFTQEWSKVRATLPRAKFIALERAKKAFESGQVGPSSVREVTFAFTEEFSEYVESLGYDGLITFEGGEGKGFDHDSYLIFDPEKAKIQQAHKIM